MTGEAGRVACRVVYWLLPNLDRLNIKSEVVHGIDLPDGFVALSVLYGLAYTVVVLVVAAAVFERKDFT